MIKITVSPTTVILVFASIFACAPAAHAVTYTTSTITTPDVNNILSQTSNSLTFYQLGDQMGSGSTYDQLTVTGVGPSTLQAGTITLDTLSFLAGVNAYVPDPNNYYSFSESMTLTSGTGSQTQTISIPFNISINYADTISIAGGSSLAFLVDGTTWDIAVNALTIGPNSGGPAMSSVLTATVTDPVSAAPLPGALALFASGLGAFALIAWHRKRKAAPSAIPVVS